MVRGKINLKFYSHLNKFSTTGVDKVPQKKRRSSQAIGVYKVERWMAMKKQKVSLRLSINNRIKVKWLCCEFPLI